MKQEAKTSSFVRFAEWVYRAAQAIKRKLGGAICPRLKHRQNQVPLIKAVGYTLTANLSLF